MRAVICSLLTITWLSVLGPNSRVFGSDTPTGQSMTIAGFMKHINGSTETGTQPGVLEVFHTKPLVPSAIPPRCDELADDPIPGVRLSTDVGFKRVRDELSHLVVPVNSSTLSQEFRTDFCIVYRYTEDIQPHDIRTNASRTAILWIDSADLQIQLWNSGNEGTPPVSSIAAVANLSGLLRELIQKAEVMQFLDRVRCHHLPLELFGLNPNKKLSPCTDIPIDDDDNWSKHDWPTRMANDRCFDTARVTLANALEIALPPTDLSHDFRPDWILVHRTAGKASLLWIDSRQGELQMQLWRTGERRAVGIAEIKSPPSGTTVSEELQNLADCAEMVGNQWFNTFVSEVGGGKQVDLLSIDPKQAKDVFDNKHWSVLGKTSFTVGDEKGKKKWTDTNRAMSTALETKAGPPFSTEQFRPRLALSVKTQDNVRYTLLMSFESRLAKLYSDSGSEHKLNCLGCYPLNNLAGADQILNNILVGDKVPLQPKSSSGN